MGRQIPAFSEVVGDMHKHATGTGGRIVDRVSGARFEDAHQGVHDFRRGEELTRLGARVVGELLDEVFVGTAQDIGGNAVVRQVVLVEVLD